MPQNPNYSMSFKDEERGTKEICRAIKFKPTSELQLQKITGLRCYIDQLPIYIAHVM
jgi:hypothetical protein